MEYSGENILTKESRGAIITPKKGFFSFCTSFPRQMKNQYFARIRACPYHFPERKVITLSNIRGLPRVCSGAPKNDFKKGEKNETIYCVCSGNRIVPEPVRLRICGCRQQPGRKQRRKHHRTANWLNCHYRAGCRRMCRRRHQLCCV